MMKINVWHKYRPFEVLVDDIDYQNIQKITLFVIVRKYDSKTVNTKVNGKQVSLANFIMNDYENIYDHIDRNPLNNQRDNLRICTHNQNLSNQGPRFGRQYKCIYYSDKSRKWTAYIKIQYKKYHLGSFKTEIEAAEAYNKAAIKHFGEFACLNIIPGEVQ